MQQLIKDIEQARHHCLTHDDISAQGTELLLGRVVNKLKELNDNAPDNVNNLVEEIRSCSVAEDIILNIPNNELLSDKSLALRFEASAVMEKLYHSLNDDNKPESAKDRRINALERLLDDAGKDLGEDAPLTKEIIAMLEGQWL